MAALLGKGGVVEDPGTNGTVALDARQHQLAHLGEQLLVRPLSLADEMQERLMLRRRPSRRRLRRHRLHALPLQRQHQADAVVMQRLHPIGMADYTGKPVDVRLQPPLARRRCALPHGARSLCRRWNLRHYRSRERCRLRSSDSLSDSVRLGRFPSDADRHPSFVRSLPMPIAPPAAPARVRRVRECLLGNHSRGRLPAPVGLPFGTRARRFWATAVSKPPALGRPPWGSGLAGSGAFSPASRSAPLLAARR